MEDMSAVATTGFDRNCALHLKHLKLKGLQPKTIEAYARAIRRVGGYFDHQIAEFETDFVAQFRHRLSCEQLRALSALRDCRSPASPMMQVQCSDCAHHHLVPHSCGHRLCPHCQRHESQQWLERQMQRLVPADHFLLTFTLLAEWRGLAAAHADVVFDSLMRCAWETLLRFSQNDRQLQGTPGAIAVLHTHARRLDFHPHVQQVGKAHARRCRVPLAPSPARAAQGLSPGAQFRLSARQLQAPDRLAAPLAEVRSEAFHARVQGAARDALRVLWRRDGDRQDAHSSDIVRGRPGLDAHRSRHLIR